MASGSKGNLGTYLDTVVFPALFERLDDAFPELGFRKQGDHWVATERTATKRLPGAPKPERVYCYPNTPFGLKIQGGGFVPWVEYISGQHCPRGVAFIEAVKSLCARSKVDLPEMQTSPEEQARLEMREQRSRIIEAVQDKAVQILTSGSKKAEAAINYLQQRGINREQATAGRFGVILSSKEIEAHLLNEGFDRTSIKDSGFSLNAMENRVVVVIRDDGGRATNLCGRFIGKVPPTDTKRLMYLSGFGTLSTPFGLYDAIREKQKHIVVVESPIEATLLRLQGESRVVACMGSEVRAAQAERIARHRVESVTIALDPDASGSEGAVASVTALLKIGVAAHIAPSIPEGLDPDEYVQKCGIGAWRKLLEGSTHGLRALAKMMIAKHRSSGETWTDLQLSALKIDVCSLLTDLLESPLYGDVDALFWSEIEGAGVAKGFIKTWKQNLKPRNDSKESGPRRAISRFVSKEDGVFAKNGDGELRKICSPLEVIAWGRDHNSESWSRHLALVDPDGQKHEFSLAMSDLAGDGIEVRKQLLDFGLSIEPGNAARDGLMSYILTQPPKDNRRVRCSPRTGWINDTFVLPDCSFGSTDERIFLKQSIAAGSLAKTQGTLKEWRQYVAEPCQGNSRLVLALSMAFAGPLLKHLNEESGGINLYGPTSIGKTTALKVGASVNGGGGERGCVCSWRATVNGLETMALNYCDLMLTLDELAQVLPQEAGEAAYLLANGSAKTRAKRDLSLRPAAEWKVLFLSSGEITLSDHIEQSGKQSKAGQQVRLADVPADAGAGHGIFEDLHGAKDGATLSRHLSSAASKHYGVALRAFLRELTRDLPDALKRIQGYRKQFFDTHYPKGQQTSGQVDRVAGRFSLIAAAGELATTLGVVPWKQGEAIQGVGKCFKAWLDQRGGIGDADIAVGIVKLRRFLEAYGESRFVHLNDSHAPETRVVLNRAGFRTHTNTGETVWYVLPEYYTNEILKGLNTVPISRELIRQGHLVPAKDGKSACSMRLPGMGKATRCYQIKSSLFDEAESSKAAPVSPRSCSEVKADDMV